MLISKTGVNHIIPVQTFAIPDYTLLYTKESLKIDMAMKLGL